MTLNDSFSLALRAFLELQPELEQAGRPAVAFPVQPPLQDILEQFAPLPPDALFIGVAEDGLPVLLNLSDPAPGPILVASDSGCGKTNLLRLLAHLTDILQDPGDLQFGVITAFPDEWNSLESSPNSLGIWPVSHETARELLSMLVSWAGRYRRGRQNVLLLLDDLARVAGMEAGATEDLAWLLLNGPGRGIWPVATLNSSAVAGLPAWTRYFRTRIFGHVGQPQLAGSLTGDPACDLEALFPGIQFTLQRQRGWLDFWIPALD